MSTGREQVENIGLLEPDDFFEDEKTTLCIRRKEYRGLITAIEAVFDPIRPYLKFSVNSLGPILWFFVPSFISSYWNDPNKPADKRRPTAYVDGLRGVAAWSVFNGHLGTVVCMSCGAGWGHGGGNWEFYKFPIISLIHRGDFAVALFFIISGYALSLNTVAAMRESPRDYNNFTRKLGSSVFRRPFRLFLPSAGSMIFAFVLIRLHYVDSIQARLPLFNTLVQGWEPINVHKPVRMDSFFAQLWDVIKCVGDLTKIFAQPSDVSYELPYNAVLWTVKLEFRSSLALFLTHITLFNMTLWHRIGSTMALIVLGWSVGNFDVPLFWIGYLFAEFDLHSRMPLKANKYAAGGWWLLFIVGCYISSFPGWQAELTPNYAWMNALTPFAVGADRYWPGIGGAMVFLAINRTSLLRQIYSSSLIQYFGNISFSMYLVHFYIVDGLGEVLFYYVWNFLGKDEVFYKYAGFCIVYVITLSVVVWAADIFWRAIDQPSVRLAYSLQDRLFLKA